MTSGDPPEDPRCPECGGPIAMAATECIHCSADLVGRVPVSPAAAAADSAGRSRSDPGRFKGVATATSTPVEHPLDPEGPIDDTLTVIVGVLGGIFIGLVGTFVLLFLTQSLWSLLLGFVAWLGSTAYLVRRRYLLDTVSKTAYGIAAVFLTLPLIVVVLEGDLLTRTGVFVGLLVVVSIPAALAAAVGWFASRYVPEPGRSG